MRAADFVSLLSNQAPLVALVSSRIYPVLAPAEAWDGASIRPCTVYTTSSVARIRTFCGTDGLQAHDVTVDCYATDYDAARAIANAAAGIVDFVGAIGQTRFASVALSSEFDVEDEEPGTFRRVLIFRIHAGGV